MVISRDDYEQLCEARTWDTTEAYHKLLEDLTDIRVKPFVSYQYFDSNGNYLGDSDDLTVNELLSKAFIEIED